MFREFEWASLKTFCNKRGISQTDLNFIFLKHCNYKNASLKDYRVCLDTIRGLFLKEDRVTIEMTGLFLPPILLKEYQGLSPAYSNQEISFARFVINSYIFCALPMPDMISMLFSTIKQTAKAKRMLTIDTKISLVLFHNVIRIMIGGLATSAAQGYILDLIQRYEPRLEDEISLEKIIRLGMKYPLLFFELRRFQNKLRRTLYGDKFWAGRCCLRTRLEGLPSDADWVPQTHEYEKAFESEFEAARLTSGTIVTDLFHVSHSWDHNGHGHGHEHGHGHGHGKQKQAKPDNNGDSGESSLQGDSSPPKRKPTSAASSPDKHSKRNPKVYDFERYAGILPVTEGSTGVGGCGDGGGAVSLTSAPRHLQLEGTASASAGGGGGGGGRLGTHPATQKRPVSNAFFGANVQGIDDAYHLCREQTRTPTAYEQKTPLEVSTFRSLERALLHIKLKLTTKQHQMLERIDPLLCIRMKNLFGYRIAKELVLESQIPYVGEMAFLDVFSGEGEVEYDEGKYAEDALAAELEAARVKSHLSTFYTPRKSVNSSPAKRTKSTTTDGGMVTDGLPGSVDQVLDPPQSLPLSPPPPHTLSSLSQQLTDIPHAADVASPSQIGDIAWSTAD